MCRTFAILICDCQFVAPLMDAFVGDVMVVRLATFKEFKYGSSCTLLPGLLELRQIWYQSRQDVLLDCRCLVWGFQVIHGVILCGFCPHLNAHWDKKIPGLEQQIQLEHSQQLPLLLFLYNTNSKNNWKRKGNRGTGVS